MPLFVIEDKDAGPGQGRYFAGEVGGKAEWSDEPASARKFSTRADAAQEVESRGLEMYPGIQVSAYEDTVDQGDEDEEDS